MILAVLYKAGSKYYWAININVSAFGSAGEQPATLANASSKLRSYRRSCCFETSISGVNSGSIYGILYNETIKYSGCKSSPVHLELVKPLDSGASIPELTISSYYSLGLWTYPSNTSMMVHAVVSDYDPLTGSQTSDGTVSSTYYYMEMPHRTEGEAAICGTYYDNTHEQRVIVTTANQNGIRFSLEEGSGSSDLPCEISQNSIAFDEMLKGTTSSFDKLISEVSDPLSKEITDKVSSNFVSR